MIVYYIELERNGIWRDYTVMAERREEATEYAGREFLAENGMKGWLRRVECDDYTIEY